jgi:hypothetical protein
MDSASLCRFLGHHARGVAEPRPQVAAAFDELTEAI